MSAHQDHEALFQSLAAGDESLRPITENPAQIRARRRWHDDFDWAGVPSETTDEEWIDLLVAWASNHLDWFNETVRGIRDRIGGESEPEEQTESEPEEELSFDEQQAIRWQERIAEMWEPIQRRFGPHGLMFVNFMYYDPDPPKWMGPWVAKRYSVYDAQEYWDQYWPHLPTVSLMEWLVTYPGFMFPGYWSPKREDKRLEEPYWGLPWTWLAQRRSRKLSLDDLGLQAVIGGHDRGNGHCRASRALLAALAGLSLRQAEDSVHDLKMAGVLRVVRHRGRQVVLSTDRSGQGAKVLKLYEWILSRVELSATAKFVYCLAANQARMDRTGDRFQLSAAAAAKKLGVSTDTTRRAFHELWEWELIAYGHIPKNPDAYRLLKHPWHNFFNSTADLGDALGEKKRPSRLDWDRQILEVYEDHESL